MTTCLTVVAAVVMGLTGLYRPIAWPAEVAPDRLVVPHGLRATQIESAATGSPYFFEDYVAGEKIDHVDGMGVMESENRSATSSVMIGRVSSAML